ncbi:hypothetical protein PRVXH_002430 [Proteinivorax hydrogeniformans]|uniref:Uncharacterized protein n=1 Tax=Proteinivorax hydrogeniformans TaxID=1826727 RepID=A0AAU8HT10_9FIRM
MTKEPYKIVLKVAILTTAILGVFLFGENIVYEFPISKHTKEVYNIIEELPADSVILLSYDWEGHFYGEMFPLSNVLTNHLLSRDVKVVTVAHSAQGSHISKSIFEQMDKGGKKYGVDYVILGYRPGGAAVMQGLTRDIADIYPQDIYRVNIRSIAMMEEIKNLDDIDMIVSLSQGNTGGIVYIEQLSYGKDIPVVVAAPSAEYPRYLPYLDSGDLAGGLWGLTSAREYEQLLEVESKASRNLAAQTMTAWLIVVVIIGQSLYAAIGIIRGK